MMANKLILIALILFVSSSVDSLKLDNICKKDVFKYDGLEVNSFYRIPQNITFPSVDSFCFNGTGVHFNNKTDQSEFESIKKEHTNTMVGLLSKNLNKRANISASIYNLYYLMSRFAMLKKRYPSKDYAKLLDPISDLMTDNVNFAYLLKGYYDSKFPQYGVSRFGIDEEEEFKKLVNLIRNLDLSNENQTMAFHNDHIDDIYGKLILLPSNITLNTHSKLIFDPKSTSTLYYDLVLPFNDKNYKPNSPDCTSKNLLPLFFSG